MPAIDDTPSSLENVQALLTAALSLCEMQQLDRDALHRVLILADGNLREGLASIEAAAAR